MAGFDITFLCYGFDIDSLPDLDVPKPNEDIIPFLCNETDIISIDRRDSEDYCFIGIMINRYDYTCDIFEVLDEYNRNIEENKETYDISIKNKITEIIERIKKWDTWDEEEYGYTAFEKQNIEYTIDYLEKLKDINPRRLSFNGWSH